MNEQLHLFPTTNTEGNSLSVLEDDTSTSTEKVTELLQSLSESFEEATDKRVDVAVFNWLMTYGMPAKPGDLRYFVQQVAAVVLGWCAANEYITFTDKALANEEEVAARPVPESAFEEAPEFDGQVLHGNFGQYL